MKSFYSIKFIKSKKIIIININYLKMNMVMSRVRQGPSIQGGIGEGKMADRKCFFSLITMSRTLVSGLLCLLRPN